MLRLRAELSSHRFRVVELSEAAARRRRSSGSGTDPQTASPRRASELSELAEERNAQAAMRAKPEAMAVELWVRAGARTSLELVHAGPGRNPEVLALRVTEAMRARGLALPPLRAADPARVAAESDKRASAADSGRRTGMQTSPPELDPDDPGVAEPTSPPPAATAILTPSKATEGVEARPAAEGTKSAATERTPAEGTRASAEGPKPSATERKPAEGARASAEGPKPATPERMPSDATPERKPSDAIPERKPSEAAPERTPKGEPTSDEPKDDADSVAPVEQTQPEAEPAPSDFNLRNSLLYVEVGPTGVWSPGVNHLGPAMDAQISLRLRPQQTSSISLVGLIPLLSSDIQRPDGAAVEVRTYGIGGFGDLHLPLGRVELSAGLGALALFSSVMVSTTDQSTLPYQPDYPTERLAALLGRIGASFAITSDVRVSGSLMAGLTVRELIVELPRAPGDAKPDPNVVWGKPLLFGNLSIELALPWYR